MKWVLDIPDSEIDRLARQAGLPRKKFIERVVDAIHITVTVFDSVSLLPLQEIVPMTEDQADQVILEHTEALLEGSMPTRAELEAGDQALQEMAQHLSPEALKGFQASERWSEDPDDA